MCLYFLLDGGPGLKIVALVAVLSWLRRGLVTERLWIISDCHTFLCWVHQELMTLREERAELRAEIHVMEKDRQAMELLISTQQAQETVLKAQIHEMQQQLKDSESNVSNSSLTSP